MFAEAQVMIIFIAVPVLLVSLVLRRLFLPAMPQMASALTAFLKAIPSTTFIVGVTLTTTPIYLYFYVSRKEFTAIEQIEKNLTFALSGFVSVLFFTLGLFATFFAYRRLVKTAWSISRRLEPSEKNSPALLMASSGLCMAWWKMFWPTALTYLLFNLLLNIATGATQLSLDSLFALSTGIPACLLYFLASRIGITCALSMSKSHHQNHSSRNAFSQNLALQWAMYWRVVILSITMQYMFSYLIGSFHYQGIAGVVLEYGPEVTAKISGAMKLMIDLVDSGYVLFMAFSISSFISTHHVLFREALSTSSPTGKYFNLTKIVTPKKAGVPDRS
jgi:hypothetical protein